MLKLLYFLKGGELYGKPYLPPGFQASLKSMSLAIMGKRGILSTFAPVAQKTASTSRCTPSTISIPVFMNRLIPVVI